MPSVLGAGLMGFAQGALSGLYDEWARGQQDQRTARLIAAQEREKRANLDYAHSNKVYEINLANGLRVQLNKDDNASKAALQSTHDAAAAAQNDADNATRIKAAQIQAGASLGAAKLRQRDAVEKPTEFFYNDHGRVVTVKPDGNIPVGAKFMGTNGNVKQPAQAPFVLPPGSALKDFMNGGRATSGTGATDAPEGQDAPSVQPVNPFTNDAAAPAAGAPTALRYPAPTPAAIAYLRQSPTTRTQFDATYGPGAAAKVIGN